MQSTNDTKEQWGLLEVCCGQLDIFLYAFSVHSARGVGDKAEESACQISALPWKQKKNKNMKVAYLVPTKQSISFFQSLTLSLSVSRLSLWICLVLIYEEPHMTLCPLKHNTNPFSSWTNNITYFNVA